MLDKELEQTLNDSFRKTREQRHEFMTVEHLLLALLENQSATKVLRACGANLNALHADLSKFIEENSSRLKALERRLSVRIVQGNEQHFQIHHGSVVERQDHVMGDRRRPVEYAEPLIEPFSPSWDGCGA